MNEYDLLTPMPEELADLKAMIDARMENVREPQKIDSVAGFAMPVEIENIPRGEVAPIKKLMFGTSPLIAEEGKTEQATRANIFDTQTEILIQARRQIAMTDFGDCRTVYWREYPVFKISQSFESRQFQIALICRAGFA